MIPSKLRQIPSQFTQRPIAMVAADLGLSLQEDRYPWFECLCPIHHERVPSFRVNVEQGFFRCFGCGARGDALELVYLVRSAENQQFTRYDAYLEVVADGEDVPLVQVEVVEPALGPRVMAEYFAATREHLSREIADQLLLGESQLC